MVGLVLRDELQTARYVTVVLPTLCWVRTSDRCLNETPRVQAQSGRSAAACRRLQGGWEVRAAVCHSSSTCRKSNTLAFSGRIHLGKRNHWRFPGEYIQERETIGVFRANIFWRQLYIGVSGQMHFGNSCTLAFSGRIY